MRISDWSSDVCSSDLFFSIPFALKAGAAFFLPVTVAFTVAVTLVPPLEWLERHRVPSSLAALLCVTGAVQIINAAIVAILFPAMIWLTLRTQRVGKQRETIAPVRYALYNMHRFCQPNTHINDGPNNGTGGKEE